MKWYAPFSLYDKKLSKNIEGVSIVDIPAEHFYFVMEFTLQTSLLVGKAN